MNAVVASSRRLLTETRRGVALTCQSARGMKKLKNLFQDPEKVKRMPVFQYVATTLKPRARVYTWGQAATGALGNPNFVQPMDGRKRLDEFNRPHRLAFVNDMKVNDVACGYGFTVIAASPKDRTEKLFGTGLNTDSQIGYHESRPGFPLKMLIQPVPISLPLHDSKAKILKVSCGRAHTVCLSNSSELFSLGNNAFGQCGRPFVENEIFGGSFRVNKIQGVEGTVEEVVCGQDHTLFLTQDGRVFACGWSADGQTGLGHFNNVGTPTLVKGAIEGEKIVHLASTVDGVLACNEKGDVFGWGNSEYAQLNVVTDEKQLNIPQYLQFPRVGKVVKVAAGGTMCALLNDKGQVFVWGYGILGKGPKVEYLRQPSILPEPLFGCNEFNPDTKVSSIYAGLNHFAAITNKGDVYMWGKNRNCCLGLNHEADQFFPIKVLVPAQVKKMSLGVDHSAALCVSLA